MKKYTKKEKITFFFLIQITCCHIVYICVYVTKNKSLGRWGEGSKRRIHAFIFSYICIYYDCFQQLSSDTDVSFSFGAISDSVSIYKNKTLLLNKDAFKILWREGAAPPKYVPVVKMHISGEIGGGKGEFHFQRFGIRLLPRPSTFPFKCNHWTLRENETMKVLLKNILPLYFFYYNSNPHGPFDHLNECSI